MIINSLDTAQDIMPTSNTKNLVEHLIQTKK